MSKEQILDLIKSQEAELYQELLEMRQHSEQMTDQHAMQLRSGTQSVTY
jgi:hypothetical protein